MDSKTKGKVASLVLVFVVLTVIVVVALSREPGEYSIVDEFTATTVSQTTAEQSRSVTSSRQQTRGSAYYNGSSAGEDYYGVHNFDNADEFASEMEGEFDGGYEEAYEYYWEYYGNDSMAVS